MTSAIRMARGPAARRAVAVAAGEQRDPAQAAEADAGDQERGGVVRPDSAGRREDRGPGRDRGGVGRRGRQRGRERASRRDDRPRSSPRRRGPGRRPAACAPRARAGRPRRAARTRSAAHRSRAAKPRRARRAPHRRHPRARSRRRWPSPPPSPLRRVERIKEERHRPELQRDEEAKAESDGESVHAIGISARLRDPQATPAQLRGNRGPRPDRQRDPQAPPRGRQAFLARPRGRRRPERERRRRPRAPAAPAGVITGIVAVVDPAAGGRASSRSSASRWPAAPTATLSRSPPRAWSR